MKSIIKEDNTSDKQFPKLMVSYLGFIVLFSDSKMGTVVNNENNNLATVGEHHEWDIQEFSEFSGTIELSNS